MAITAAELLVKISADAGTLDRDLTSASRKVNGFADRVGGKLTRGLGGAFSAMGRTALRASAVAGTALAGLGVAAVKAAAEAEQVAAQTTAAIESTGGAANVSAAEVDSLAQSIMQMSGISDEAVGSAENLLLTFTNIRNETGAGNDVFNQATLAVADLSTRMGGDMQGAALQVGKALNDPIKGISALTRVGVAFTDQQKEQIKALVASGDTMGAQKIILAELAKEFGGSAEAAGKTFTGQLNIAKETIGNTMEEIGSTLLTAIGPALPKLTKLVSGVFEKLGPTISRVVEAISSVLGELLPVIGPVLEVLGEAFMEIVKALAPAIGPLVKALLSLAKAFAPIVPPLAKVIGKVAMLAAELLSGLVPVIEPLIDALLPPMMQLFDELAPVLGDLIPPTIQIVKALADLLMAVMPILPPIVKLIGFVAQLAGFLTGKLAGALSTVIGWVTNLLTSLGNLWSFISGLPGKIAAAFGSIRDAIVNAFKAAINFVIGAWNALDFSLQLTMPDWLKYAPFDWAKDLAGKTFGIADIFPDVPMLAQGGVVTGPTLAMVGERGPEAVIPLSGSGGQGAIQVSVNLDRKVFGRQQEYLVRAAGF